MKRYNKRAYAKRKNKRKLYLVTVFFLLLSIGLGYAYLQSVLTFSGTTKISKNNWDIHFDNLTSTDNTKVSIQNNTSVVLNVTLNPGEEFTYTVDAVNNGTIDAMIGSITPISVPAAYQNVIEYSLNYQYPGENETISVNDALRANTSEKIKFKIKYKDEDELSDDVEGVTLNLNFTINYIQADEHITNVTHVYPTCRKATTLHTEECTLTGDGCYSSGYTTTGSKGTTTVTYGHTDSTKLTNGQLTNGQSQGYALDCDLNGNGVVDTDANGNSTERFYYVSDLYTGTENSVDQFDNDYAVLIYYKNYGSTKPRYYYENSARENWHGPVTLVNTAGALPERTDWTNTKIGLKSTSRNIYTETGTNATSGGTVENPFTYTNKVGRLLTTQEVNKGCNTTVGTLITGELDSCEYLMEDTDYVKENGCSGGSCYYWLETPYSSSSDKAWFMFGYDIRLALDPVSKVIIGSRPVIEMPKTDISLE